MRITPFSRPTIIAAVECVDLHTQGRFDQMVLRLGLENDIPQGGNVSVTKKSALLGRVVLQKPAYEIVTVDGKVTLAEAVVREAVQLTRRDTMVPQHIVLLRGLARDGFVVTWDEHGVAPNLRAALPGEIDLPATDDEVHQLLKYLQFHTPLGHLDQALEAHTRGDWAAANSQLRTFLEGLFDEIARAIRPSEAGQSTSAENRRALLAGAGFFAADRNEWTQDGKNYINGLFKMLHTEGSHPGLSDEDHSTFRLHVVLVTARTFLRRLRYGK
jgi:hypothetical protein